MNTLVGMFTDGTTLIEGEAKGADELSRIAATDRVMSVPIVVERYPAEWELYGPSAGPKRNTQMLVEGKPDVCFFFHRDLQSSKGTANMVLQCLNVGIPVYNGRLVAEGRLPWPITNSSS